MPRPAEHRVESFVTPVRQPELTVPVVPYVRLRAHTHPHNHTDTIYCINTTHTIINHRYYHRFFSIYTLDSTSQGIRARNVIRAKGGVSFVSSIRFYYLVTTLTPRPFVEFFFNFHPTAAVTDAKSTKDKNLKKKKTEPRIYT